MARALEGAREFIERGLQSSVANGRSAADDLLSAVYCLMVYCICAIDDYVPGVQF